GVSWTYGSEHGGAMGQAIEQAVVRAIMLTRGEFGERITVDDMARAAMFSKFHFSRLFQRSVGVSPGRFLSAIRLQGAKELLLGTPSTVSDVAHFVGFSSPGTFASRFTRSVGLTPTSYRQQRGFVPVSRWDDGYEERTSSATILGTISGALTNDLVIFVGLFPSPIAEAPPIAWSVRARSKLYALKGVPKGTWYVIAYQCPTVRRLEARPCAGLA